VKYYRSPTRDGAGFLPLACNYNFPELNFSQWKKLAFRTAVQRREHPRWEGQAAQVIKLPKIVR
jgi:hypothetical protein